MIGRGELDQRDRLLYRETQAIAGRGVLGVGGKLGGRALQRVHGLVAIDDERLVAGELHAVGEEIAQKGDGGEIAARGGGVERPVLLVGIAAG